MARKKELKYKLGPRLQDATSHHVPHSRACSHRTIKAMDGRAGDRRNPSRSTEGGAIDSQCHTPFNLIATVTVMTPRVGRWDPTFNWSIFVHKRAAFSLQVYSHLPIQVIDEVDEI